MGHAHHLSNGYIVCDWAEEKQEVSAKSGLWAWILVSFDVPSCWRTQQLVVVPCLSSVHPHTIPAKQPSQRERESVPVIASRTTHHR